MIMMNLLGLCVFFHLTCLFSRFATAACSPVCADATFAHTAPPLLPLLLLPAAPLAACTERRLRETSALDGRATDRHAPSPVRPAGAGEPARRLASPAGKPPARCHNTRQHSAVSGAGGCSGARFQLCHSKDRRKHTPSARLACTVTARPRRARQTKLDKPRQGQARSSRCQRGELLTSGALPRWLLITTTTIIININEKQRHQPIATSAPLGRQIKPPVLCGPLRQSGLI